jgi:hypothetical protein
MSEIVTNEVLAAADGRRLAELRLGLLTLHKALLAIERINFEKVSGRVTTGELLQLVLNHPQFGWLRTISALLVQIDEMLDADEPANAAQMINLIVYTRHLLTESENKEFNDKYKAALQQEPEVVMAHAALMKALRQQV